MKSNSGWLAAMVGLGALALVPSCVADRPEEPISVVRSPLLVALQATDDTVVSSQSSANLSTQTYVTAGAWTNSGAPYHQRGYLKFDLSSIPANATIQSAVLELAANTVDLVYGQGITNGLPPGHSDLSGSNTFLVRRVTSPWSGSTTTYQNAPSVTDENQVTAPGSTSPTQNYAVDVTAMVRDMVSDPLHSFGVELRLVSESPYREVTFASSEFPDPALRPRLVLDYQEAKPVTGFADLHLHTMAEAAFGGRWLHGPHEGPLSSCDGGLPPSDHARLAQDLSGLFSDIQSCGRSISSLIDTMEAGEVDPVLLALLRPVGGAPVSEVYGQIPGSDGDTGLHLGRAAAGSEWPSWDTIAHQQSHVDWLKQAHEGGLNLVVMSAVSYRFLCELLPPENGDAVCDEMGDIDDQLTMAHALDTKHDWIEIALTPADARRIIHQGKLAMVLSIEASNLFEGGTSWQEQFDHFYERGVRTLQPVHQTNNRFGGAALHHPVFQLAQYIESCHVDHDCSEPVLGFDVHDVNGICENVLGLTQDGRELLSAMMERHMMIDLAHGSNQLVRDVVALTEANDYYPLYVSHGHVQEIMSERVAHSEKATQGWVMAALRRSGGMFGLRTFHEEARSYSGSQVENDCAGSSRSFAQALDFAQHGLKVPVAFGSDLNGMIQQTRPRFGEDACSATEVDLGEEVINLRGKFTAQEHCEQASQRRAGPAGVGSEFDTKGLAHVGLLPDLLRDLRQLGADTAGLEESAEHFIRMWERAFADREGHADPATDVDLGGVAAYEPVEERFDDYPTRCNRPYCADYQELDGECRFDAECASQQCANVPISCGLDVGKCVCDNDADCGGGSFCSKGLPGAADNACELRRADHEGCSRDDQCQSGSCGGCATLVGWCYTPDSKAVGDSCRADRECRSNRCSADCILNPSGRCLCTSDGDCASSQYCGWGANSGECRNKKGRGSLCASGRECSSGRCRLGFCR
jgi:microsomal dipeptidase-like Zn-dependent dipeptidase